MKKSIIVFIFTSIITSITIFLGPLNNIKYNKLVIDNDTWNSIIKDKTYTNISLINDVYFNNNSLFYDNLIFYYSTKDNYNPVVRIDKNELVKVAFDTKITDEIIKNNESISMLVYTKDEYNIIKIKVTTLPILSINYDGEINRDSYIPMNLYLYDNNESLIENVTYSDGVIKYRGASTYIYPKKAYRISLRKNGENNNISLLGLRKDDDYLLYAAYNDQDKVRNVFSSKLWYDISNNNLFNLNNGMEYRYVEVFINGEYNGLYALGYPIDKKTLDVSDNEYMFKKTTWDNSESTVIYDNDMLGYELQNNGDESSYTLLKDYYKKLLYSNDSNTLYDIADINNAIDIFLFNNLVEAKDNGSNYLLKNIYITFKYYNNKLIAIYTPWDLDLTFGNISEENENLTGINKLTPDINAIMKINPTYMLIKTKDTNIKNLIYKRYTYLRKTVWSNDNIKKILNSYENDIFNSGAFLRDKEKWPDGNYNDTLNLKEFTNYVMLRLKYMDDYIENLVGYCINNCKETN